MSDNMKLWESVSVTDPAHTKQFKRPGGFSGTSVSPMYLIHKATELWGPMGGKWGVEIVEEIILEGAPILNKNEECVGFEKIHQVRINLRHPAGTVPAIGQTALVVKNKYGFTTDEEAPKKSLTDALCKGLSWLGFAADIYLGLYDDVKYVNDVRKQLQGKEQEKEQDSVANSEALLIKNTISNMLNARTFNDVKGIFAIVWQAASANVRDKIKPVYDDIKRVAVDFPCADDELLPKHAMKDVARKYTYGS